MTLNLMSGFPRLAAATMVMNLPFEWPETMMFAAGIRHREGRAPDRQIWKHDAVWWKSMGSLIKFLE